MKIALILVEIRKDIPSYSGNYYEGVASISSSLKADGHIVFFTHLTKPISKKNFTNLLRENFPDLLAFSSMTNGFFYVKNMAIWAKETFDIPILCGGIHATLAPEEVISTEGIDMACIGEGEDAIVELCNQYEKGEEATDIKNIWFKRNGEIIKNPVRHLIRELDHLPPPDRDIFDFKNLISTKEGFATFLCGRGCPFSCAYCGNHAIRKNYPNKGDYVRFKSPKRVIEEIKGVFKSFPQLRYVAFSDDILPLKITWLTEFAEEYKKSIGLPFKCNIHPSLIKEETISLLKDAGCSMIEMGIESGNERIRYSILNRRITDEQIKKAADIIRKYDINLATYNMVGLPGESMREISNTIRLNGLINPKKVYVFIFYPYPGTRLYEFCEKEGLLTDTRFDTYTEGTILKSKFLGKKKVVFAHRFFKTFVRIYSITGFLPAPLKGFFEKGLNFLIQTKLPYRLLIKLHRLLYKTFGFIYIKFARYVYNRQKRYYS